MCEYAQRLIAFVLAFMFLSSSVVSAEANIYQQLDSPFYDADSGQTCSSGTAPTGGGSVYMIGDSLSVGMNGAGMEKKLTAAGNTVAQIEATVGISVPASIPKIKEDKASVAKADTVIVELGTNDGGSDGSLSSSAFEQRIKDMLDAIKSINKTAQIYWMNAYKDKSPSAYSGVNNAINKLSDTEGYSVIDWYAEASAHNSKYAPFDSALEVHPQSHYSELADFVVNSLKTDATSASGDSCSCSETESSLAGSDNEEKAWNYFKAQGLTDQQVAGILGNIQVESAFNPIIMQKGGTSQNPADADPLGWGLIQWTPGSKVVNMAQEAGVTAPIYLLGSQLDLVWQHMHNNPVVTQTFSMSDFKAIHDEKQAAIYFRDHIEGGADANGVRETDATKILGEYKGTEPSGGASGCAATAGSGSCKVVYDAQYSQQQLAQIFGNPGTADSHPDIHLTSISFLGHNTLVSPLIAPCLDAVAQEIKSENVNYDITEFGCYRFDSDNGSSNIGLKSYHTYGAACDINWSTNPWSGDGSVKPHDMPEQYIKAFHDHGFTWGGDWHSVKDYMHFEWHGVIPK